MKERGRGEWEKMDSGMRGFGVQSMCAGSMHVHQLRAVPVQQCASSGWCFKLNIHAPARPCSRDLEES